MPQTVRQIIDNATKQLNDQVDDAYLDSRVLCSHALQVDRSWLISHADDDIDTARQKEFERFLQRRQSGEPIAYITGSKEFWSLPFKVTTDTLIPRPETEHLVEQVIQLSLPDKNTRLLDFGTGCGAIAIAIAHERTQWKITAVDISDAALIIANENARTHQANSIQFIQANSLSHKDIGIYDVIVSNPPYVAKGDPHLASGDVRFEPMHALVSGNDGLDCIRELVSQAPSHLTDGGYLMMEHGYDQGEAIRKLLTQYHYANIHTIHDLAGHERATIARWRNS